MLAKRVMSPFKEFVKLAKRYNNIKDEDPNKEDLDIKKDHSARHRSMTKSKHHKKSRAKALRQQFQNRTATKQSLAVSFSLEPKVSPNSNPLMGLL
jgi:uncharacterized membrane protein YgaE (UPF0421/DUF939 family)